MHTGVHFPFRVLAGGGCRWAAVFLKASSFLCDVQARLDTGRPCPAASHAAVLPARKPAPQTIEAVAAVVNAKLAELGPLEPATVDQLLDDIEDMF